MKYMLFISIILLSLVLNSPFKVVDIEWNESLLGASSAIIEMSQPSQGTRIFPQGFTREDQFIIPMFAEGTTGPSGQVIGWGIASVLAATANTRNLITVKAIVVADANGVPLLRPVVRDVTIVGYDDTNPYTRGQYGYGTGGSVEGPPFWSGGQSASYDGLVVNSNGATLENLRLFYIPGTALEIKQSGDTANVLRDISITRVLNGIDFTGGKHDVENVEITGVRDYAIRVGGNSEVTMRNIHLWNGGNRVAFEVLENGKVYVEGLYPEQSQVGVRLLGDESYISGLYSWGNHVANAEIFGESNQLQNFVVKTLSGGAGFVIGSGSGTSGQGTVINNGGIKIADNSIGIRLAADQVIITNTKLGGYGGSTGRVGIRVEKAINNSIIDVDCSYLDLCLDLNDDDGISRLGRGNVIRLRNTTGVIQMANLPATWDSSNRIYFNGVLQNGGGNPVDNGPISVSIPTIAPFNFNLPPSVKPLSATTLQNVPSGYLVVPNGVTSMNQYMIPRYGDGTTFPAGQIIGNGESTSVLSATENTRNQTIRAVVFTEDWGRLISAIQGGTCNTGNCPDLRFAPAILSPVIRDVTIQGHAGDVSANPEVDLLYDGVLFGSSGGKIEDVTISGIPGTALSVGRYSSSGYGSKKPFDATKPTLNDVTILNSFRGLYVGGVDHFLSDISVGWVRDYAVHLKGAAAQVYGMHTFGSGEVGIWVSFGQSWLNGDIETEGQKVGIKIGCSEVNGRTGCANGVIVNDLYSHDHSVTNVQIVAGSTHFSNFNLEVMPDATGFDITGQRNVLDQGRVTLEGTNSVGIRLSGIGADFTKIDNTTIQGTGEPGQVGMVVNKYLIGADIDVTFSNLETGIDLNPEGRSMLGWKNIIRITTTLDGNPNQMIKLPPTWASSNKIYINGVLLQNGSGPFPPSCQADVWLCGNWSSCSNSGSQNKTCTKTFDCPSVNTSSPATSQSCTPLTPPPPFLAVGDEEVIEKIEENMGKIEENFIFIQDYSPSEKNISMLSGEKTFFSLKLKTTDYDRIEWYLDNRLVKQNSLSFDLDSKDLAIGNHTLEVVIIIGEERESISWSVQVIDNNANLEYAFRLKDLIIYVILFIIFIIILLIYLIVNKKNSYY